MGFLNDAKNKAQDLLNSNKDKISQGVDKVAGFADDKTGGKHSDQINKGANMAKEQLDKLDD